MLGSLYLLGGGVRNGVREIVKVLEGLLNGVFVQVEAAQRVYNADMQKGKVKMHATTSNACTLGRGLLWMGI
jgi:hypothetical protein